MVLLATACNSPESTNAQMAAVTALVTKLFLNKQLKGSSAHSIVARGNGLFKQETSYFQASSCSLNAVDPRTNSSGASMPTRSCITYTGLDLTRA